MFINSDKLEQTKAALQTKEEQGIWEEKEGYELIGKKSFSFACRKISVDYTVLRERKINIIERHILKAGAQFEDTGAAEIAKILNIDKSIIIQFSLSLAESGLIDRNRLPKIILNKAAEKLLNAKSTRIKESKNIILNYDYFAEQFSSADILKGNRDDNFYPKMMPGISWSSLKQNQQLEIDEDILTDLYSEQNILTVDQVEFLSLQKRLITIYLIHDLLRDKFILRAYSPDEDKIIYKYEEVFERLLYGGRDNGGSEKFQDEIFKAFGFEQYEENDIQKLNAENPAHINEINEKAKKEIELRRKGSSEIEEREFFFEYLSSRKIRKKYLELIKGAEEEIIILSGWINSLTVDKKFIDMLAEAAADGVLFLLGWGMDEKLDDELRNKNNKMGKKLSRAVNSDGVNCVSLYWLGESHQKEVIVDREKHILGSHNFLSYRGDGKNGYSIRNESAFFSTYKSEINASFKNKQKIFWNALKRDFHNYLEKFKGSFPKKTAISAWIILEKDLELLNLMERSIEKDSAYIEAVYEYLWRYLSLLKDRDISEEELILISEKISGLTTRFFGDQKREKITKILAHLSKT
ncbi:hypothetical protein [Halanaerobium sp.]|uniref:hypothetical protein n=1 Tax=Halanaerobium sp. TaxID=1895664 RepID=UPI0025BE3AAC|nr:hypothetical protein [Halanaerobium sp.]